MSITYFFLALPVGFGAGLGINYLVFKGIEVYSKSPDKKALSEKRNNFLYAFAFGIVFVLSALLVKDLGIDLLAIIQQAGFEDITVPILILVAGGWLIVKVTKKKKKKSYLTILMYILFLLSILFLLVSQPTE